MMFKPSFQRLGVWVWVCWWALALGACGGGGGDSKVSLGFSPTSLSANIAHGESGALSVTARISDSSQIANGVFVFIEDKASVLLPSVELTQLDSFSMRATLHTSPSLAAGRYQGQFQVHLCLDDSCRTEVKGSPYPLPYDFTVAPEPLKVAPTSSTTVAVHRGAASADAIGVQVSGTPLAWTATPSVPWLQATPASGVGPGSFSIQVLPASLAEGSFSGEVVVRASDGQQVPIGVALNVLPVGFSITGGVLNFAAINGAPIPAQTLNLGLDNDASAAWNASGAADWLQVTPSSGTTPTLVTLQVDPSRGALISGNYQTNMLLSSPLVSSSKSVPVTLSLTPATLSAPVTMLSLGGPRGRDVEVAQALNVSLNTGTQAWPFTLNGLPDWLSASATSGTVNQVGTTLSLKARSDAIAVGSTSGELSLSAKVNGDTVNLPVSVTVNADQRRLLASEWGVGLASSPAGAVLSRKLSLRDNFGAALAWTASSNASWLSVTASGSTGAGSTAGTQLSLSANPATLSNGSISYATVTAKTATAGVSPAVIRVALWKSSTGLADISKLSASYRELAADSIRPYVYAHNGGSDIDVFNAHTGQKVASLTKVAAALGKMSVSPDGSRLFALDTAAREMAVVNLDSQTRVATWTLDQAVSAGTAVAAVRTNGTELVFVGDATVYQEGRNLGPVGVPSYDSPLVANADGSGLFTLGTRYAPDYSAVFGGTLFSGPAVYLNIKTRGNPTDVAVSRDGRKVYSASGGGTQDAGYRCAVVDGGDGSFIGSLPGGDAYPNNVEVTVDGRAICGISGWYSEADFWVHQPNGALIRGYKFAGYAKAMLSRQMVVTPDGLVVVALTDDPLIAFVPIGAP